MTSVDRLIEALADRYRVERELGRGGQWKSQAALSHPASLGVASLATQRHSVSQRYGSA